MEDETICNGILSGVFCSINTYFISHKVFFGTFVVGVIISLIWSFNVKKIAFGTLNDRIIYAIGAGAGSLVGLLISSYFF